MRLIHQVIDDLRGLPDEEVSPIGAALEELLGGERGSLPELTERFTRAGLGAHHGLLDRQWAEPADQHRATCGSVLGEERAEDLATLAGLSSDALSRSPGTSAAGGGASHDAGR